MNRLLIFALLLSLLSCKMEDPATPGLLVPKTVDQDPTLPQLAINGTLLHVETYGKATDPLLVLIHGGPGGDYRSLLQAKVFANKGYFVIFYDQRGTGLSQRVDRSVFAGADAIQLMIDDLGKLIEHFQKVNTQKVFLMGHSWGAMLATAFVNQYPDKISGWCWPNLGALPGRKPKHTSAGRTKSNCFRKPSTTPCTPSNFLRAGTNTKSWITKLPFLAVLKTLPATPSAMPGHILSGAMEQWPFLP
nr:alpha/beta hydrolase [Haliscomenobacter sp.]